MATILYKKQIINLDIVLAKFQYVTEEVGHIVTPKQCALHCGNSVYFWTKCLDELIKLGKVKKGYRKTYYILNYKKLSDKDANFYNAFWHGYQFAIDEKLK